MIRKLTIQEQSLALSQIEQRLQEKLEEATKDFKLTVSRFRKEQKELLAVTQNSLRRQASNERHTLLRSMQKDEKKIAKAKAQPKGKQKPVIDEQKPQEIDDQKQKDQPKRKKPAVDDRNHDDEKKNAKRPKGTKVSDQEAGGKPKKKKMTK